MRADRLVAIVLLLQAHGSLTAAALAERLETSERTVRRDLDALLMAGVPLFSRRGRGGGWQLIGGHRIDLSGLTAPEAQALLLATAPGTAALLGPEVGAALAAARQKVLAALPEPLRAQVATAGSAVLVDHARWRWGASPAEAAAQDGAPADHLDALRLAVIEGRQAVIAYEPPGRPAEDRTVHPHGLVVKRGVWYLVAGTAAGPRTYRLSRVRSVALTDLPAERPPDFDLARAWDAVVADVTRRTSPQLPLAVEIAATPAGARRVSATVGAWWPVEHLGADSSGRILLAVRFPGVEVAAAELAAAGDDVVVIRPDALRAELAGAGRRLLARYGERRDGVAGGD